MTGQELIELVQSKTPDELTLEEIEQLHASLAESPELQQVLFDQLQMEQYLADVLGRIDVSVDEIMKRAGRFAPHRRQRLLGAFGWLAVCLVFALLGGGLWYVLRVSPPNAAPPRDAVALADKSSEVSEEEEGGQEPVESPRAGEAASDAEPRVGEAEPSKPPAKENPSTSPGGAGETERTKTEIQKEKPPQAEKPSEQPDHQPPKPQTADSNSPKPPWLSDDQLGGPRRSWQEVAFVDFGNAAGSGDIQRWFGAVPGKRNSVRVKDGVAKLEGALRLKAPWQEDALLRLKVRRERDIRLLLYSGTRGAVFKCREPRPELTWSGYVATRGGNKVEPQKLAFTSSDHGRAWRSGGHHSARDVTLDIRHQDGVLILARGGVRLLTVPMEQPPEEVYVEGKFELTDVRMLRCEPLPEEPEQLRDVILDSPHPAELPWLKSLAEGTELRNGSDGNVELRAVEKTKLAWAAIPLAARVPQEVILKLDKIEPGTGVYLGNARGEPLHGPRFLHEKRTGNLVASFVSVNDGRDETSYDFDALPVPLLAEQVWVRMLVAGGRLKCYLSVDGRHWGQVWVPDQALSGAVRSVGLYCAPVKPQRQIRLRRVIVRRFPAMASLASTELLEQAPAIMHHDLGTWLERVTARQPVGVASGAWHRACIVRSLATGIAPPASTELLVALLRDEQQQNRPPEFQLQLLDEAILLADTWSGGSGLAWRDVAPHYRHALAALENKQPDAAQVVARRALQAPFWTAEQHGMLLEAISRRPLLSLLAAQDWDDLYRLSRELVVLNARGMDELAPWAATLASRHLEDEIGPATDVLTDRKRHPLIVDLTREGYNVLAELDVAVEGEAWEDACKIITSTTDLGTFGLLPDARDSRLWSSFPLAVAEKMRQQPQLGDIMRAKYGPVGELRVREAMAAGDLAALEQASIQFYGTAGAALARLWLGDRALSAGDFATAIRHYETAAPHATLSLRRQIEAHRRLAAAMLGQRWGQPVATPVEFGEWTLPAERFESLIADTLEQRGEASARGTVEGSAATRSIEVATPARFGVERRESLGETGRSLGLAVDAESAVINDGATLRRLDLESGDWKWSRAVGDAGQAKNLRHNLLLTPAILEDQIVAHVPTRHGGMLASVDRATGAEKWNTSQSQPGRVISDPLFYDGAIYAVTADSFGREVTLSLTRFDPASGQMLGRRQVANFRRSWQEYVSCSFARFGDAFLILSGGSVLSVGPEGEVRWARRQVWIPPELDSAAHRRPVGLPLAWQDRLLVCQATSPVVECLEKSTGRLVWRRVVPGLRSLVGVAGDRMVVMTDKGLEAFACPDGEPSWNTPVRGLQDVRLAEARGRLLHLAREREDNQYRLKLGWLDPANGRLLAKTTVAQLRDKSPAADALTPLGNRLLLRYLREAGKPNSELVALARGGEFPVVSQDAAPADRHLWEGAEFYQERDVAGLVLPGWIVLGAENDGAMELLDEHQGELRVLATKPHSDKLRAMREISIPRGARSARLEAKIACHPQGECLVDVKVGGTTLWRRKLTGGKWQTESIDLLPYAGQTVWIAVRQHAQGPDNRQLYWQYCRPVIE